MSLFARKHHKLSKRPASTECHYYTRPSCVKLPSNATEANPSNLYPGKSHKYESPLHKKPPCITDIATRRAGGKKGPSVTKPIEVVSHHCCLTPCHQAHTTIQLSSDSHYSLQYHCNKLAPSTILYHHFTDP